MGWSAYELYRADRYHLELSELNLPQTIKSLRVRPVFRLGNGAVEQTESELFLFFFFQHILIILGTFAHT